MAVSADDIRHVAALAGSPEAWLGVLASSSREGPALGWEYS